MSNSTVISAFHLELSSNKEAELLQLWDNKSDNQRIVNSGYKSQHFQVANPLPTSQFLRSVVSSWKFHDLETDSLLSTNQKQIMLVFFFENNAGVNLRITL